MILNLNFLRIIKCSFKDLVTFPSWEVLSQYWKKNMLVDLQFLYKGDPRRLCGVTMDPFTFIPLYLKRFIERKEMEGYLLPSGHYKIIIKVILGQVFSEFRNAIKWIYIEAKRRNTIV